MEGGPSLYCRLLDFSSCAKRGEGALSGCFGVLFFFFFLDHTHSMWKFPGQGWDPTHSSNPSPCSDNTSSFTRCTAGDLPGALL